jgi:hypothetical protein
MEGPLQRLLILSNGRQTPSDGKSSPCLWQSELKIKTKLLQYFEKSYYRVPYYKSAHLTIPRATTLYQQNM